MLKLLALPLFVSRAGLGVRGGGHVSPLVVETAYANGTLRKEMRDGFTIGGDDLHLQGRHAQGTDEDAWLDTLARNRVTVTMKDATTKEWAAQNRLSDYSFKLAKKEGGSADAMLAQVRRIRFLHPARVDSARHAMFDNWIDSPFTGQKLP